MMKRWACISRIVTFLLICPLCESSALAGSEIAKEQEQVIPIDLDLKKGVLSKSGAYRVEYKVVGDIVPSDKLHDWLLTITDTAGNPVEGVLLEVINSMPGHHHGAKTAPKMTQHVGKGRHLIEGMFFNMQGWWITTITIKHGDRTDHAELNIMIK